MTVFRKWYCNCSRVEKELVPVTMIEDETDEPTCPKCGATPSSDPRHTVRYRDQESWDD